MSEADDFLAASSRSKYPAIKFPNLNDAFKGTIVDTPKVIELPSLNPPHDPEKQLVVNLDPGDGEPQTLWVRKGFLAQAIQDAITESGTAGLAVGGELTVQFNGTKDTGKVQPAKLYRAKYTAPAASAVAVGDIFGDD